VLFDKDRAAKPQAYRTGDPDRPERLVRKVQQQNSSSKQTPSPPFFVICNLMYKRVSKQAQYLVAQPFRKTIYPFFGPIRACQRVGTAYSRRSASRNMPTCKQKRLQSVRNWTNICLLPTPK
jgi:hypothetical protein